MDRNEVVLPGRRERRRHSAEFKAQVVEACLEPGVSIAAVALANGLNANFVRQWVKAHREGATAGRVEAPRIQESAAVALVPVTVAGLPETQETHPIRLDLRRGGLAVQMAWPAGRVGELAVLLKDLLR